jgi:dihydrofolate reductase
MRKLKLYIATSIDGKIAGPNHELDWLPEDEGEDFGYYDFYATIDTTIMGYKTYDICVGFGDWPYKDKKNFILSRNPDRNIIKEAELVTQDPITFVKGLKEQQGKDIWLVGGGEIIKLLHDAQLIDEYLFTYIPVILGEGIEMFPNLQHKQKLNLAQHKVYENGVVSLHYTR